jgi:hypothetical protein
MDQNNSTPIYNNKNKAQPVSQPALFRKKTKKIYTSHFQLIGVSYLISYENK